MNISIKDIAEKAITLMDLTSLTDTETTDDIIKLCQQSATNSTSTAAICIYPRFIPIAKKQLKQQGTPQIKVATVTNFPHGNDDIDIAVAETRAAIAYGADEVDVVFPYKALQQGNEQVGFTLVNACKAVCGDKTLKVIIESGELSTNKLIKKASEIAILAGADFIKTSTGKVKVNATIEAAETMLSTIKQLNKDVGFKAAGGVKTVEDAALYINLAADLLGADWVNSSHFRFGASGLLTNLLNALQGEKPIKTEQTAY